jgi:hypothetical protein
MRKTLKISVISVVALLVGCGRADGPTEGKPLADISKTDLVQLCERADLQDIVLDIFVEAMFKRNVANAGFFGSMYDQGLSEEKARQETSIENARAKRHSTDQVDCTVDFVSDVASDSSGISEVKFADARYSLIRQPDNTYQVVPKKASFFANVFIDGISAEAWKAQAQLDTQDAREAELAEKERLRADQAAADEVEQASQDADAVKRGMDMAREQDFEVAEHSCNEAGGCIN